MDYVIVEFIYMLLLYMNLQIGKVKNFNNKILISMPSFKTGTNVKINLDGEKDKPKVKTMPNIEFNKEQKQDVR